MGGLGFYISNFFISYYGLHIVLGIVAATILSYYQIRRFHVLWDDLILLCSIMGLCAVIGAKILYILVSLDTISIYELANLVYLQNLMAGGFVFYGGFIGAILGIIICRYGFHINTRVYAQYFTACIPLAHSFGRVGCHIVGCCYGRPYQGPGAIVYTQSLYAPNGISLFPIQLTEAIGSLLISLFLVLTCKRWKGYISLAIYISLYAVQRFILEFFRYDTARGKIGFFSTSQFISIIMLSIAIFIIYLEKKHSNSISFTKGDFNC